MDSEYKKSSDANFKWRAVFSSSLLLFGLYGSTLSFGVFLKPLSLAFDWKRGIISGAMSFCLGVSGLSGILAGRVADKYGERIPVTASVGIAGLSFWLMSHLSSIWHLYLFFGLGLGMSSGGCYSPISAYVSKWFTEKRTLALGVTLLGVTIGQMVLSPLCAYLINTGGWEMTFKLLSIIVWMTGIPAILSMKKKPYIKEKTENNKRQNTKEGYSVTKALRESPFWMLMIMGFALSAGSYFITTHIVAYGTDIGLQSTTAAFILTVMGFGGIAGTLLAFYITVKLGNKKSLMLLLLGQTMCLFLLFLTKRPEVVFVSIFLFGLSFSATVPIRTSLVAHLFGVRAVASIIGLNSFAWAIGGIVGPYLAGLVFDASHEYRISFLAGGVVFALAALAVHVLNGCLDRPASA